MLSIIFMKGLICMIFSHGNDEKYSVSNTPTDENSPLRGKTVIFLGSSVTFGSASKGESFVEYLAKKDIERYRAIIAKLGIRK